MKCVSDQLEFWKSPWRQVGIRTVPRGHRRVQARISRRRFDYRHYCWLVCERLADCAKQITERQPCDEFVFGSGWLIEISEVSTSSELRAEFNYVTQQWLTDHTHFGSGRLAAAASSECSSFWALNLNFRICHMHKVDDDDKDDNSTLCLRLASDRSKVIIESEALAFGCGKYWQINLQLVRLVVFLLFA